MTPDLQHGIRRLALITEARDKGATWAAIGATLGMTGPEAKRDAHRLAARTRRAQMAAERAG